MRVAIIGSGLAALAAAKALGERGVVPLVIDAGDTLESDRHAAVARMGAVPPDQWAAKDLALVTENPTLRGSSVPKKYVFGSDYIYSGRNSQLPVGGDSGAMPTLAQGGYSVAWGGAVLPPRGEDVAHWPVPFADLQEGIERVLRWLPLSGTNDGLEKCFPLYGAQPKPVGIPEQARDFQRSLERLSSDDLAVGLARLAVDASQCRTCGICLSGCPYGAIFSTQTAFRTLADTGAIDYQPGWVVRSLQERTNGVEIVAAARGNGAPRIFAADRVVLAAGALNSTHILLRSLSLFDTTVRLQDSQKFVLPLLRPKAFPLHVRDQFSLAALFLEMRSAAQNGRWMHMQVSGPNDFVIRRLGMDTSALKRAVFRPVVERMMILWSSLHSAVSGYLDARLVIDPANPNNTVLHLTEGNWEAAQQAARRAGSEVAQRLRSAHALVLPMAMQAYRIGSGNHIGGSFPMRSQPRLRNETDTLGRPSGLNRVHVVDSTVFPDIPASTIALPIMANADRIARRMELT